MSLRARTFDVLLGTRFRARVAVDTVVLIALVGRMVVRNGFAWHAVVEGRRLIIEYLDAMGDILGLWKAGTSQQRHHAFDIFRAQP